MALVIDNKHCLTCPVIIIYDSLTDPDTSDNGKTKWSLEVAIHNQSAEYGELYNLVQQCAQENSIDPNAKPTFKSLDATKFADIPGGPQNYVRFSAGTYSGCPEVRKNGIKQTIQSFQGSLYAGAMVQLLTHCYPYDYKGKGISIGLDAVVIVDDTTEKLQVAGGLSKSELDSALAGAQQATTGTAPQTAPPAGAGAPTPPPAQTTAPQSTISNGPQTTPPPPGQQTPPPPAPGGEPQITQKAIDAGYTYQSLKAAKWSDDQMRAEGYIQ